MTFLFLITGLLSGALFIFSNVFAALVQETHDDPENFSLFVRIIVPIIAIAIWVGNSMMFYYLAGYASF